MSEQLIEQLADLEHERWSRWMRWMFDNWTDENIIRWKWQMITPYAELPEHSKESDRKEARRTMEIVSPLIAQLEADNVTFQRRAQKYNELIMYVATKYPNESRHETAIRYIVERENQNLGPNQAFEAGDE